MKDELERALNCFRSEGPEAGAALFAALLDAYPLQRDVVLRERSRAYCEVELFDEALCDRQAILDAGGGTPGDCYFAGEYALQAGQFALARELFDRAIESSLRSNSTFYLHSSRLLAALASYQLGEDAQPYLDLIDDQVEVLWLKGFDRVTKQLVIDAMNHGGQPSE